MLNDNSYDVILIFGPMYHLFSYEDKLKALSEVDYQNICFKIDEVEGLSDVEKEIIYDYYPHWDRYDHSSFFLRSSGSRVKYKNESIPHRETEQKMFHRGDVLIVNDNLAHYRGELEVVLTEIPNDGERNLIGRIKDEDLGLLDFIKPGQHFKFIK